MSKRRHRRPVAGAGEHAAPAPVRCAVIEPTHAWLRCLFRAWRREFRRRHVRMLVQHPHHYATAAGITAFLFLIGHFEAGAIYGCWSYAFIDNLTSLEGEAIDDL